MNSCRGASGPRFVGVGERGPDNQPETILAQYSYPRDLNVPREQIADVDQRGLSFNPNPDFNYMALRTDRARSHHCRLQMASPVKHAGFLGLAVIN